MSSTTAAKSSEAPTAEPANAFTIASSLKDSSATTPSAQPFLDLISTRRTIYTLSPESTIPDSTLLHILRTVLEQTPSTFGSFTTRLHVAIGAEHHRLWDTITEVVQKVTPADRWADHTKPRLDGFRNAYATVLFFEDPTNTKKLQENFAFAKDHFPVWSQHTSAMHQFAVWTALANVGMGGNLQHYNPLVDAQVKELYGISADWNLVAQLVIGKPTAAPADKPTHMKASLEERLVVHGAKVEDRN